MTYTESAGEKLMRIADTNDLQAAIQRLEEKKSLQESELRAQLHTIVENLKPKNILKNTLADVRESSPFKSNLLKLAIGLGVGYFSRKLIINESAGLLKKTLGTALEFGLLRLLKRKKRSSPDENESFTKREESHSQEES